MTASRDATVVAELTPPGRGAVAVVVVAGSNALEAVRRFFFPITPWPSHGPPIGRIVLGRWGSDNGEELVLCRRCDNVFEIHCHGGVAAAPAIVEQLVSWGSTRLSWRDWILTSRHEKCLFGTFESRRDSAAVALAEATTERTASVLLDQYHGALSSAIDAARDALAASEPQRARAIIEGILAFREVGLHLTKPWRVVIAGPPNVGKSSLLNAIAGYQRAIVSPQPGTTRDVVTIQTAINGWPVQIADTAGLRETRDELEIAGVAHTGAALEQAELVICVSDATAKVADAPPLLNRLPTSVRVIHAVNKVDLVDQVRDFEARDAVSLDRSDVQFVSARTGQGIAELLLAVEGLLVPVAPPAGAAVPFTPVQVTSLDDACDALDRLDIHAANAALASLLSWDGLQSVSMRRTD